MWCSMCPLPFFAGEGVVREESKDCIVCMEHYDGVGIGGQGVGVLEKGDERDDRKGEREKRTMKKGKRKRGRGMCGLPNRLSGY